MMTKTRMTSARETKKKKHEQQTRRRERQP